MTARERSRELEFFGWFEAYLELGSTFSEGFGPKPGPGLNATFKVLAQYPNF